MRKIYLAPFALLLMLLDQISKWWVIEMFFRPRVLDADGPSADFMSWLITLGQDQFPRVREEILPVLNFAMAWNKGVSFSMFANDSAWMPYFLGISAVLFCLVLLVWLVRTPHLATAIPLSMIIAGALSNVWDRARFGAVADFLDFHWDDLHFATFNIADCCIVVGVLVLAFDGLVLEPRRLKNTGQEAADKSSIGSDVKMGVISL
ncbi:MAG: signal peptidase II [Pseudobdellovibrionaceae bacterium]